MNVNYSIINIDKFRVLQNESDLDSFIFTNVTTREFVVGIFSRRYFHTMDKVHVFWHNIRFFYKNGDEINTKDQVRINPISALVYHKDQLKPGVISHYAYESNVGDQKTTLLKNESGNPPINVISRMRNMQPCQIALGYTNHQ